MYSETLTRQRIAVGKTLKSLPWMTQGNAPNAAARLGQAELALFDRMDAAISKLIASNRQRAIIDSAGLRELRELKYEMGEFYLLIENASFHDAKETHGKIAGLIFSAINAASFDAMCAHCAGSKRSATKAKLQYDDISGACLTDILNTWLSVKRLRSEDKMNVIN
jgi:hypothetical protein